MKIVTSVTVWNDAIGKRMSITYSEVDDTTGQVTSDNKRIDRVVTDAAQKSTLDEVASVAQAFVDAL